MDSDPNVNSYDDEIDLKELFLVLWAGKFLIAAITAVFAVSSVLYALSIPNQYKATAILAPAQSDGGGLSSALGQLGGLASLAGVSLGEGAGNESDIAQEIMRSWGFVDAFISEHDLAVDVYATKGWSTESGELIYDTDVYDIYEGIWLLEDDSSRELRPPTSWELYVRFQQMITLSEDKLSGLVSISIEHYSPQIAKEWVDLFTASINAHMQKRQISKVSNNIAYLEDQIKKTSIAQMQEVFYTIVEEQIKNKMVAEASPDYAFVTVSPSMVPEEKNKPNRALICILGTFFGGMVGVVTAVTLHGFKNRKKV